MTRTNRQITTGADALTVNAEPLITLYHQWQAARAGYEAACHTYSDAEEARNALGDGADAEALQAARALVATTDAAHQSLSHREDAIAEKIARTPPRTIAGVLVKIQMAEFHIRETHGRSPTDVTELTALNAMRDARRFLARAEADSIEAVPELPSNSFAVAEAEIARRYEQFHSGPDHSDAAADAALDPANELDEFIATTPPASMADVAVKLRRALDKSVGVETGAESRELTSLAQILAYVHTITGEPTYPTRPTSTGDDETEDGEADTAEAEAGIVSGFREMIGTPQMNDTASGDQVLTALWWRRAETLAESAALCEGWAANTDPEKTAKDAAIGRRLCEIEAEIIGTRATSVAGLLVKVQLARAVARDPKGLLGDGIALSMASDIERLYGTHLANPVTSAASPELVALAAEEQAAREALDACEGDNTAASNRFFDAFAAAEAFPARNVADVALKIRVSCRAHEMCDHHQETIDRALADLDTLAATQPPAAPDPLIAMCAEWHRLTDAELAAFDRIPRKRGPKNEAAQAEAEAAQEQSNGAFDRLAEMVPVTFAGYLAQLGVIRRHWLDMYIGPVAGDDDFIDPLQAATYRILGHAARFAAT